jgi:phage baseplate assembly protein W
LKKEQVQQYLQQLEQQAGQAPADKQDMIQSMRKILETRLQALEGGK